MIDRKNAFWLKHENELHGLLTIQSHRAPVGFDSAEMRHQKINLTEALLDLSGIREPQSIAGPVRQMRFLSVGEPNHVAARISGPG